MAYLKYKGEVIRSYKGDNFNSNDCLSFTALLANSSISMINSSGNFNLNLEYSFDGDYWDTWDGSTIILGTNEDTIYLRSTELGNLTISSPSGYYYFLMTGKISCSGSILYLLSLSGSRTDVPNYCYEGLFSNCTSLTTAPLLPATSLALACYSYMFLGCTSLTTAPLLPATQLYYGCYGGMFYGCTSLTTAPELLATNLANRCYSRMFSDCTSLVNPPSLLPATLLAIGCYDSMFRNCTSLTTIPNLPRSSYVTCSYLSMFWGCTSLVTVPLSLESSLSSTGSKIYDHAYMFLGCTSLITAPTLNIKSSTNDGSLSYIFANCTSLNEVRTSLTSFALSDRTQHWLYNVSPSGTFYYSSDRLDTTTRDDSHIPVGWDIVKYSE